MGKYSKKNESSSKKVLWIVLAVLLILTVAIPLGIWGAKLAGQEDVSDPPAVTQPSVPEETEPEFEFSGNVQQNDPIEEISGLQIDHIDAYTGIYMEDGSDEMVSDVMMMILTNTTSDDLQLARIYVHYSDFVAEFEVTNLPSQASVVLLEKNRHPMVEQEHKMINVENVVFFPSAMSLMTDTFQIVGGNGYLDITNISDTATSGNVFIYYKNSASDLLYGGITYRVRIENTIQPGETVRVTTKHYRPENCRLIMVTCAQ